MTSIGATGTTPIVETTTGAGGSDGVQSKTTQTGSGVGGTGQLPSGLTAPANANAGFSVLGQTIGQSGNTSEALSSALSKLTDPSMSADERIDAFLGSVRDSDMLGKLIIEFATMQRQDALDQRLQARETAKDQLLGQADKMRDAAAKAVISAVVSLVMSAVSAGVTLAGAAASVVGAGGTMKSAANTAAAGKSALQSGNSATAGATNATKVGAGGVNSAATETIKTAGKASDTATAFSQMMGAGTSMANSGAGLSNSAGGMTSGMMDSSAKIDDAEGQELAAVAQENQANADVAKKFMDELEETMRSAISFMKEQQDAEANQMQALTRV